MTRFRVGGTVVALMFGLAGCHLIFPFEVEEAQANDLGVTDAQTDGAAQEGLLPGDGGDKPTCAQIIGKPCKSGDSKMTCQPGVCIVVAKDDYGVCGCPCKPDDVATPTINEDSCPVRKENVCSGFRSVTSGQILHYCFKRCTPKIGHNPCELPLTCQPGSANYVSNPDYSPVCMLKGCAVTPCWVITKRSCKDTADCSSGDQCLPWNGTNQKSCAHIGPCDSVSGLCAARAPAESKFDAKVGDKCEHDLECGSKMFCLFEYDTALIKGAKGAPCTSDTQCCGTCDAAQAVCTQGTCPVVYRNGYCSIRGCLAAGYEEARCPVGSTCNRIYYAGLCQKECQLANATSCRDVGGDKLGDYECRAWNNVTMATTFNVSDTPVCDFGTLLPCSHMAAYPSKCGALGLAPTNTTNMSCRDLKDVPLVDQSSPLGFCLDDTPSGS